jgi:hypothetical protein
MLKSKIRRAVIREWMVLAPAQRRSTDQAATFAWRAIERHSLPRSRRTPHAIMMAWLKPRTGRP